MDGAHILLDRFWLHDLNMMRFESQNTHTFIFNRKKVVLTPFPPKSPSKKQKNRLVTNRKGKKLLHFMNKSDTIGLTECVKFRYKQLMNFFLFS